MPATYSSHADVIAALGIAALAREIGVSSKMVGGWKTRNSIPGGWYCAVAAAATVFEARGVTVGLLAHLAAVTRDQSDNKAGGEAA